MLENKHIGKIPIAYRLGKYRYIPVGFHTVWNKRKQQVFKNSPVLDIKTLPVNYNFVDELVFLKKFLNKNVNDHFINGKAMKSQQVIDVDDVILSVGFGSTLCYRIYLK